MVVAAVEVRAHQPTSTITALPKLRAPRSNLTLSHPLVTPSPAPMSSTPSSPSSVPQSATTQPSGTPSQPTVTASPVPTSSIPSPPSSEPQIASIESTSNSTTSQPAAASSAVCQSPSQVRLAPCRPRRPNAPVSADPNPPRSLHPVPALPVSRLGQYQISSRLPAM